MNETIASSPRCAAWPGISRSSGPGDLVPLADITPLTQRPNAWPIFWLVSLALELAFGGLAWSLTGRHGPALVAVMVNLALALRFAVTLRPGSMPLISRYAQCDPAGLPPAAQRYTRALTVFWALLLGLFALAYAAAMADFWATATLSWVQAVACPALFLAEHALRSRILPELGRATPYRTFQAILAHARGGHAR